MNKLLHPTAHICLFAIVSASALVGCNNAGDPAMNAKKASSSEPSAPEISLMDATVKGNGDVVRQHVAAGTDLNQRNAESGATALIAATSLGHPEAAILLIEAGADLEVKDNQGATVLLTAAFLCREEITKALLAKGANKNARNNAGSTPLDSVIGPFDDVKPIYDLLQAALAPLGLKLDYERIRSTRPKIADILRAR